MAHPGRANATQTLGIVLLHGVLSAPVGTTTSVESTLRCGHTANALEPRT